MNLNFCQRVAPSTDAASYCSVGMAKRAATKISVQNGSDFQMCMSMENDSAKVGSFNQLGPSKPVQRKMALLMMPHSGFSMKRTDKMVGIEGTAHGKMKMAETILIHQRSITKKPDSAKATIILMLMPTTKNTKVLTALRKKIGSLNKST